MKHSVQPTIRRSRGDAWPAPEPSTLIDREPLPAVSAEGRRPSSAELIMTAGLAAILVSILSAFVEVLGLPPLATVSLAATGAALVFVGASKRCGPRSIQTVVAAATTEAPVTVDLPWLTVRIGGVLAQLRRQYGMAYRTRTWIEQMLPAYGAEFADPALARDLLGAAALDAGGIRADVTAIAEHHTREQIVATGSTILSALQNVLAACEVPTDLLPTPNPSDPSSWPTSR